MNQQGNCNVREIGRIPEVSGRDKVKADVGLVSLCSYSLSEGLPRASYAVERQNCLAIRAKHRRCIPLLLPSLS